MKQLKNTRLFLLLFTVFLMSCSSMQADSPDTVWIDVRTIEEYQEDHINGDRNIPIQSMSAASIVDQLGLDADTPIGLYCFSGGRAGRALTILEEAGYTNAFNAGGISDARERRGL